MLPCLRQTAGECIGAPLVNSEVSARGTDYVIAWRRIVFSVTTRFCYAGNAKHSIRQDDDKENSCIERLANAEVNQPFSGEVKAPGAHMGGLDTRHSVYAAPAERRGSKRE